MATFTKKDVEESYQTTMDMYGTISIDEMQEMAARKLGE